MYPTLPIHLNAPKPTRIRLPRWLVPILCILASAAATVAFCEFVLVGEILPLMEGKWLVVEGELEGATLEFFKDGTMISTRREEGQEVKIKGKVQMTRDGFQLTTASPFHAFDVTHEQTILDLSERQFVIQDNEGLVLKMERVSKR